MSGKFVEFCQGLVVQPLGGGYDGFASGHCMLRSQRENVLRLRLYQVRMLYIL